MDKPQPAESRGPRHRRPGVPVEPAATAAPTSIRVSTPRLPGCRCPTALLPCCRAPAARLTAPAARGAGGYRPHCTIDGPRPRRARLVTRPRARAGTWLTAASRGCRLPTDSGGGARPGGLTRKPMRPAGRRTVQRRLRRSGASAPARLAVESAVRPAGRLTVGRRILRSGCSGPPARLAVARTARPAGRQMVRRRHRRSGCAGPPARLAVA
jgi:hypothetical protein